MKNTHCYLEIICVDDGSTDNSLAILNEAARIDQRIKIISTDNNGVSKARNLGLAVASGDYVSFVDADDWIHPKYFEILLSIAKCNNADIVIGKEQKVYSEIEIQEYEYGVPYKKMSINDIFNNYGAKQHVWGRIYRKKIMDGIWFDENIKYGEDVCFNLNILLDNKI